MLIRALIKLDKDRLSSENIPTKHDRLQGRTSLSSFWRDETINPGV